MDALSKNKHGNNILAILSRNTPYIFRQRGAHNWVSIHDSIAKTTYYSHNLYIRTKGSMARILYLCISFSYYTGKQEVTISPGVTTGELMNLFMKEKICFKTDVIAQNFTYGGVLANGSHVRHTTSFISNNSGKTSLQQDSVAVSNLRTALLVLFNPVVTLLTRDVPM